MGDQGRYRLLPEERDGAVDECQRACRDHQHREPARQPRAARAAPPTDRQRTGGRSGGDRVVGHPPLSSQSGLRSSKRTGAGVGHRAANRHLDVVALRALRLEESRAGRRASSRPERTRSDAPEDRRRQAEVSAGEQQDRAPRQSARPHSLLARVEGEQQGERSQRRAGPGRGPPGGAGAARARRAASHRWSAGISSRAAYGLASHTTPATTTRTKTIGRPATSDRGGSQPPAAQQADPKQLTQRAGSERPRRRRSPLRRRRARRPGAQGPTGRRR